MTNFIAKLRQPKIIILLIILVGGGWYYYNSKNTIPGVTKYILGTVEKGNIIATVSGSGQVASTNQVDLKPTVSAEIKQIKVLAGQKIKIGDVIAVLNDKDLKKQVKQAQDSLAIAKANLDLKLAGPTAQDLLVSEKSVESAKLAIETANNNLENTKLTLAENSRKAELQLVNAKISFDNAKKSYDNTMASGNLSQSNKLTYG